MSPFSFGKNFLEEQFLVIDNLESRIIKQEITLEELVRYLEVLIKNTKNKDVLQAVLEKINELHLSKEAQKHIQQILHQLHQSNIIGQIEHSLNYGVSMPQVQQYPSHSVFQESGLIKTADPTIQVYDEWTDTDTSYDTGEWYEGISFTTNLKRKTNNGSEMIRLAEDIQEQTTEQYDRPILPSYEGVDIVVADASIANSLQIPKFEVNENLAEDTYPYNYVETIIQKVNAVLEKTELGEDFTELGEIVENKEEEQVHHHNEDKLGNEVNLTQEELTELLTPVEDEDMKAYDIRDEMDLEGELDPNETTLKDFEDIKNFNTPPALGKKFQKEYKNQNILDDEEIEALKEQELLEISGDDTKSHEENQINIAEIIVEEESSHTENLNSDEPLNTEKDENKEVDSFQDTDSSKILEDIEGNSYETLDSRSIVKPAESIQNSSADVEEESSALFLKKQNEDVVDGSFQESDLEDHSLVLGEEEEQEDTEVVPEQNLSTQHWWIDYPVLEYPETEDFGTFILYRDLG